MKLGPDAERPAASDENRDWLWINSRSTAEPTARPAFDGVFRSDGKEWQPANLEEVGLNLDLSVPTVRAIIFGAFKERSEAHFKASPGELFVFGTDPEDGGGYTQLAELLKHPNWYPEYLAETGGEFGRQYVLHGFKGLDQPRELWDATAPSDIVFGFNNWLLAEYDRWLESLPAEERITSTGRVKRDAVRCSLYSYNYHDVPPNFNVDPRVRVMIASYPKHRGRGKWKAFASQTDLAEAFFGTNDAAQAASDFASGPAHFTLEETAAWWSRVLEHWPLVTVTHFAEATLADGNPARGVDLNDLVAVEAFGREPCPQAMLYNSGYQTPPTFLCVASQAGEEIGFQLDWPADPTGRDGYYIARDLPYGISVWNSPDRAWEQLVDKTLFKQPSAEVQLPDSDRQHHLVMVRYQAPRPGTYRFEIGYGGNLAYLTDLGFDPATGTHTGGRSLTFDGNAEGLTQSPAYIYIPKGTKTLDLEVWDSHAKTVTLYKSLPPTAANVSRKIDISARQTHRIELAGEETGTLAVISGNGFAFPYLYSVPMLWSKSPSQLLVPRAVATADGLTISRRGSRAAVPAVEDL